MAASPPDAGTPARRSASRRRSGPATLLRAVALLVALGAPAPLLGQVEAAPILNGQALLGDSVLGAGMVTLHLVSPDAEGELDSVRVAADGSFSIRLPRVPDPERSEIFFASIRHQGILYFGGPVTLPVQLDSIYRIQVYDTLMVTAPEGTTLPLQVRNVFLEPDGDAWRVTDLFQVRNDGSRTLVTEGDGAVWRYPLPPAATDPTMGQSDLVPGATAFEDGDLVIRSPIPPGERLFVVRYMLPDPFLDAPSPGTTDVLDVLVREPAPPLDAPALASAERIELEPGTTYRRFSAEDFTGPSIRLVEGSEDGPPPVRWIAIVLALVLTAVGLWAVLRAPARPAPAAPEPRAAAEATAVPPDREAVIMDIARLDEAFEARADPTDAERAEYQRTRRALLARLG